MRLPDPGVLFAEPEPVTKFEVEAPLMSEVSIDAAETPTPEPELAIPPVELAVGAPPPTKLEETGPPASAEVLELLKFGPDDPTASFEGPLGLVVDPDEETALVLGSAFAVLALFPPAELVFDVLPELELEGDETLDPAVDPLVKAPPESATEDVDALAPVPAFEAPLLNELVEPEEDTPLESKFVEDEVATIELEPEVSLTVAFVVLEDVELFAELFDDEAP